MSLKKPNLKWSEARWLWGRAADCDPVAPGLNLPVSRSWENCVSKLNPYWWLHHVQYIRHGTCLHHGVSRYYKATDQCPPKSYIAGPSVGAPSPLSQSNHREKSQRKAEKKSDLSKKQVTCPDSSNLSNIEANTWILHFLLWAWAKSCLFICPWMLRQTKASHKYFLKSDRHSRNSPKVAGEELGGWSSILCQALKITKLKIFKFNQL